jgi:PTH1 family peptidyl-tRNA hydrolase
MKLIVGLGNPGFRYRNTRHNVGYMTADRIAEALHTKISQRAYSGLVGRGVEEGETIVLLKPTTMMNLSGRAVSAALEDLELSPEDLILAYDEVQLDVGRIRIRPKGSAGGHRGVTSVIAVLGTERIPRVRIGIGGSQRPDLVDHVLAPFSRSEWARVAPALDDAAQACLMIVRSGIEAAMNRYNGPE